MIGIAFFFSSFQNKREIYINSQYPAYIKDILSNPILNYIPYFSLAELFGVCVCIFFNLKKNNKSLLYVSIGIYLGTLIISSIAISIYSIITFCMLVLFSLFSLIFGIYLYIKYEKEDKIPQIGNTNTGNLV